MQNIEPQNPDYTGLFDDIEYLGELLFELKQYSELTPAQRLQGDINKLIRKV